MARVTTEDCIDKVPNRFDLVILAAMRARELASGLPAEVERENDKNPVIALREIADELQIEPELRERAICQHQTQNESDEPEDNQVSLPHSGAYFPSSEMVSESSLEGLSPEERLKMMMGQNEIGN